MQAMAPWYFQTPEMTKKSFRTGFWLNLQAMNANPSVKPPAGESHPFATPKKNQFKKGQTSKKSTNL